MRQNPPRHECSILSELDVLHKILVRRGGADPAASMPPQGFEHDNMRIARAETRDHQRRQPRTLGEVLAAKTPFPTFREARMMRKVNLVATLLLWGCSGCRTQASGDSVVTTKDSLGIRIVENRSLSEAAPWVLDTNSFVDVGGATSETTGEFSGYTYPVRLTSGRIVVATGGELRYFDARGNWQRSVGRPGAGPGEFKNLGWLSRGTIDTLFTYDWSLRRFSTFSGEGELIREQAGPLGNYRPTGVLEGGAFLLQYEKSVDNSAAVGAARDTVELVTVDPGGTRGKVIGRFLGSDYLVSRFDRAMSVSELPFGSELLVSVRGANVYVGRSDRAEILVLGPDGQVVRLLRWDMAPSPVTSVDIDQYIAARAATMREGPFRALRIAALKEAPFPRNKPLFSTLLIGEDGAIWIGRYSATAAPTVFDVFDSTGRSIGHVEMPTGLRPTQISASFVLGTWEDPDDVQHVRVHALRKRSD